MPEGRKMEAKEILIVKKALVSNERMLRRALHEREKVKLKLAGLPVEKEQLEEMLENANQMVNTYEQASRDAKKLLEENK